MDRRLDPRPKGRVDHVDCSEPDLEFTSRGQPPPNGCGGEFSSSRFVNPAVLTLPSSLARAPPAYELHSTPAGGFASGAASSSSLRPPISTGIAQHKRVPFSGAFPSSTSMTCPSPGYSEETYSFQDLTEIASTRSGVGSPRSSNGMRACEQTYSSTINHNEYPPFQYPVSIMSPSGPVNAPFHEAFSAPASVKRLQDQRKRKQSPEQVSMHSQKRWRDICPKDYSPSNQAQEHSSFDPSPTEGSSSQLDVPLGPINAKLKNCMHCRIRGTRCKNRSEISRCTGCQKAFAKIVNSPAWRQSVDLELFAFFDQDMDQRFLQFCSSVNSQHAAYTLFNEVNTCYIELHSGPYPNQFPKDNHFIQRSSSLSRMRPSRSHLRQPVFDRAVLHEFMACSVLASSESLEKFREVNRGAIAISLQILAWLSILRNEDRMNFYFEQGFSAHEAKEHALNIFHSILWAVDELLEDLGGMINEAAGSNEANWEVYLASELLCASIKKHVKGAGCKSPELGVLDIFWEHVEVKASTIKSSLSKRSNTYGVWFCAQGNSPCLQRFLELRTWQKNFRPIIDITFAKYRKDRPSQAGVATLMAHSFVQVLEAKTSAYEASIETLSHVGLGKESIEQEQHRGGSTSRAPNVKTKQKPWLGGFLRSSPEPLSGRDDDHVVPSEKSNDVFSAGSWVDRLDDDDLAYLEDPKLGYIPDEMS